jgi:hypothetical protein
VKRLDKPVPKIKPQPLKWLRHFFTTLDKLDKLWTKLLSSGQHALSKWRKLVRHSLLRCFVSVPQLQKTQSESGKAARALTLRRLP